MATSYVQAANYTKANRGVGDVDVIVVHTMEAPEKGETAESIAGYFARPSTKASAHANVDNNSLVLGVRWQDIAWAAPGANHNGYQIEHAGYARQSKADWQDPYSQAMLRISAKEAARIAKIHKLPLVWLSAADLRAGKRGITSHNNVSKAFRRSDHWDPGDSFPVQQYLALVRKELGLLERAKRRGGKKLPPARKMPRTLRKGDEGWEVKKAQVLLRMNPELRTGRFGKYTFLAVKRFQRRHRLEVDGVIGPETWKELLRA